MSLLSTPEFVSYTLHIWTIIALPVHILGFYCILFKTPEAMKSVKMTMLNFHFWSVLLDVTFSILNCPCLLFPALASIPFGVTHELGLSPKLQTFCIFGLVGIVGMSIFSIFENRFYLLFSRNSCWHYIRYPVLGLNYSLAATSYLGPYLDTPDQKFALEALETNYPYLPITRYSDRIFVLALDHSLLMSSVTPVFLLGLFETLTLGALLMWNMKSSVRKLTLSPRTYQLQKNFLQAVLIQIFTPLIIMVLPVLYFAFSVLTNYYNQALNNLCVISLSLHGWVSAVVMLLIHTPYRNCCLNRFGFFKPP